MGLNIMIEDHQPSTRHSDNAKFKKKNRKKKRITEPAMAMKCETIIQILFAKLKGKEIKTENIAFIHVYENEIER